MSSFNEFFKSRGAKTLIDRFLKNTDMYSKNKITSYTFEILEDNFPAAYYTENKLTASFIVKIKYILNDNGEELETEFEVPKEIDKVFIIEGKYRIPTNTLNSDFDIRFRTVGSGDHLIIFDYNRRYDISKKVLRIERRGDTDFLDMSAQRIEIKYDNIDSQEGDRKELLKLTENQIRKLQIKLDLDYKPEYITTQLIDQCIAFGDDRMRDLIVDKTIDTVSTSFMKYMIRGGAAGPRKFIMAKRRISNQMIRNHRLPETLTPISSLAIRFFKGSSDAKKGFGDRGDDSNLQVSPGINAMNLGSLSEKVTVPKSVAYNPTYADLIDIADTPINQNTNLQNSLTVSTHITDKGILFDVYDKNFKKITIEYLDYLNMKVCSSDYVDYEHKVMKPNADGKVEVKYRMKRKLVDVSEVELIDLHPDYRLSSVTRRLPFVNSTDSVRISMGTSMLKQSIPLTHAQRPLVDTGRSEELLDNVLNEKYGEDSGVVTAITEDKVVVKSSSGKITEFLRETAIKSQNDVAVFTEPKVKVGQKVKRGDIITGEICNNFDTYKSGVNALVLFHAYFGLVNEDALVISESFANRLASYSIIDFSINITDQKSLKWIAPIGTKVKSGDPIVSLYKAIRLSDAVQALNDKLGGIYGESDISTACTIDNLTVSNNIDEGYVSDVMIQYNANPVISTKDKKPDFTFALGSQKGIDEYMKDFDKKRQVIYDQFPEYVAADRLRPIVMDPTEFKIVYTVRVRIIKRTIGMVGSKITNRYGGKGVVSTVKPDELMPIMVDKNTGKQYRVEVIMNPYSTISRKIAGVLWEQDLGNIAHRIYGLVEEYKKTKTGQKKIMPLIEKYYPGRYTDLSVEEFIHLHETQPIEETYHFCVGCYSDYTGEKIEKMMEELHVESKSDILIPETEVTDLEELKENLDPKEYEKVVSEMTGKLRKIDKPLQCGWMTLEELFHIPSYSNKVTTSLYGNGVSFKKDQPILGRGLYRETGQKIGEMELWALLSRNAKKYIQTARGDTAKEDNQIFLNNLLGLGLTVKDDKGYNQGGSDLKAKLAGMKTKFRLKIPKK